MATYGEAIDLILTELGRSDTSITAVVEREYLKAIDYYQAERFWFNEARISFTASNTIYYPLSSLSAHLLEIDQMTVLNGSTVEELAPCTHSELQAMDASGTTGQPTHWAIFAEQIRLYPKTASGSTYQVDVFGTKKLASLTTSTQTNAWTTEALNLIASRVEKVVSARRFKDYDAAQMYEVSEQQEFDRLKSKTERLGSSGKLRPGY